MNAYEPASVVAARQLAREAHEAPRDRGARGRRVADRLAVARALRDCVGAERELTGV